MATLAAASSPLMAALAAKGATMGLRATLYPAIMNNYVLCRVISIANKTTREIDQAIVAQRGRNVALLRVAVEALCGPATFKADEVAAHLDMARAWQPGMQDQAQFLF